MIRPSCFANVGLPMSCFARFVSPMSDCPCLYSPVLIRPSCFAHVGLPMSCFARLVSPVLFRPWPEANHDSPALLTTEHFEMQLIIKFSEKIQRRFEVILIPLSSFFKLINSPKEKSPFNFLEQRKWHHCLN